ncbi:MAG: CHASE2 domain-containing protein, partial [Defluviitaleaceae bacterium]|nr:CHASE2 domain-containing protein [Defluviitaleaceae bacterium]
MKKPLKNTQIKKIAGVVVTAFFLLAAALKIDPLWQIELWMQDSIYQKPGLVNPEIMVLGIDEYSLEKIGRWPWPRNVMADIVNALNGDKNARPSVIAIDVMYTEEGYDAAADAALVLACEHAGNVVLASNILTGLGIHGGLEIKSRQLPFDELLPHVSHGLVNTIFDADNLVRSVLLRERDGDNYLYSFPAAVAAMHLGTEPGELIQNSGESYLSYAGRPDDYYVGPVASVFADDFDPHYYEGCIVFIGPYAMGMQDAYATPVSRAESGESSQLMYGVEIHANAVQMILEANFKEKAPDWFNLFIFASALLIGMLLGEFMDVRVLLGVFAAAASGYVFLAAHLYGRGTILQLLYLPAVLAAVFIYQMIYGYIIHAMDKAKLRSTFKKYVDPKLVD